MKYIYLITILLLVSCKGDEPNPNKDCNCGTVANDGIDNGCHWLEIRNNCTDNKKRFCVDADKWLNAHIGSQFCVTNSGRW